MSREVDAPLRSDVRFLGRLLGEVLVEQEGEALFSVEEVIRKLSIRRRRGPRTGRAEAQKELVQLLEALPIEQAEPVLRAFAMYFRLVNIAEQHHRIRRARAHASNPGEPPQRGSLAAAMITAKKAGVSAEAMREALARLEVTLTLTAHPTEAARRTVLEKLYRIARRLEERDRCRLLPREEEEARAAIREEITVLWQTDEVRREKPTVGDEVKNVLWYVEEILWDLLPELPLELVRAFERAYGEPLAAQPMPLRIHAWPGGDMDGNPNVTPEVVEDAIRAYRARGLRRLLGAVRELGGSLSQSARHVRVPEALIASLADDAVAMPGVAAQESAQTEGEPWRRKLRFVEARLAAALEAVETERQVARQRAPRVGSVPPPSRALASAIGSHAELGVAYRTSDELHRDLLLVADTLHKANASNAGEMRTRALAERVRVLGLSIAELELRAPAEDATAAAAWLAGGGEETPGAARLLAALRKLSEAQRQYGERSARTLILSMTQRAEDLLAALTLARAAGLYDVDKQAVTVDIVPLFETHDALVSAPTILRTLLAHPEYRRHLMARGVQEVMVGYSDSGKEVGLLAAAFALRKAQSELTKVSREAGIALRVFHGRGESVARGGGPAQQAILALPAGSVAGRYKATEQGEALDHKYARPELALRTLELMVGGALLHTLGAEERPSEEDERRYAQAFEELAEEGRRVYRALVWENPRFVDFFTTATPVDEIARLPIGSRPSKRKAGGLEALRAIPWVFGWTQNRAILPGWYGVGSALDAFARREGGAELLVEMTNRWPFFRTVLDNVQMVLAKSDMEIAARYAALASPATRKAVWPPIKDEHARTVAWIKRLFGVKRLLDGNPTLQRSIDLRNPYVDPMSFLQVALLRRKRAGDACCDRAILLSINGIAAGMRNTG
ncbi:phosphoenolpyruvate carboxylase [Polyangium mundeleinium]|uniref:Phosphoenolpyruvate carboxylase n=1 Tax=Polyangium mundeleinium TaxID=2995306 RepID=A0ABT5EEB3_9BACT|nr:phosphoenolpyruvate carboxylase [Polyangium mundeleinium]MDC0739732.1 phosphoenolpyruvate carboxylase [Polyangium mundeleinium]